MQRLAFLAGQELIVQNMSLQTDSSDLLGGYRPLEIKQLARPIYVSFVELFVSQFSKSKNTQFLDYIYVAYEKQQWKKLSQAICKGIKMGMRKVRRNRFISFMHNKELVILKRIVVNGRIKYKVRMDFIAK